MVSIAETPHLVDGGIKSQKGKEQAKDEIDSVQMILLDTTTTTTTSRTT